MRPSTAETNPEEHGIEQPAHGKLLQSVFLHIASCLRRCDPAALSRLGLRTDQKARIAKMTATDLLRLCDFGRQCVTFTIDPKALDEAFALIDQRRRRDELLEDCIRHDAPRAMMAEFFGVSRRRYTALRTLNNMPPIAGRVALPTMAIEARIYEEWVRNEQHWSALSLLRIAKRENISLRVIWDQLTRHQLLKKSRSPTPRPDLQ